MVYEALKKDGICHVSDIAWMFQDCELVTFDKLVEFADKGWLDDCDLHFLEDGKKDSVYWVDADGYVAEPCRLTENNCIRIEHIIREQIREDEGNFIAFIETHKGLFED